jgi:hypothetical protein
MSNIITTISTKNGDFEVYNQNNNWYYKDTNLQVEELYQKALMTRGLGNISVTQDIPYNALLLSTITKTPKHFWYSCNEEVKVQIQKVLNDTFSTANPLLLDIRSKYMDEVKTNRLEALQEGKKRNNLK